MKDERAVISENNIYVTFTSKEREEKERLRRERISVETELLKKEMLFEIRRQANFPENRGLTPKEYSNKIIREIVEKRGYFKEEREAGLLSEILGI